MFFVIAAISVAHVLKQQYGVANTLCKMSGLLYKARSWSGICIAVCLHNIMFQKHMFSQSMIEIGKKSHRFTQYSKIYRSVFFG